MTGSVTHVFFDATDTLLRVRGSVGAIYRTVALRHGVDVAATDIQAAFATSVGHVPQPVAPCLDGHEIEAREKQWWYEVARRTFADLCEFDDFDAFASELFDTFREARAWEGMPHVQPALEQLQRAGFRLGIISDMDSRLLPLLHDFDLTRYFDGVFLSFQRGYCKPDARLFEIACHESGVDPSNAVHVGDSWRKDVEAARAAGLHAVWYRADRAARPTGAATTDAQIPVVHDLLQLPGLLAGGVS